jgi:hypothetical protein
MTPHKKVKELQSLMVSNKKNINFLKTIREEKNLS